MKSSQECNADKLLFKLLLTFAITHFQALKLGSKKTCLDLSQWPLAPNNIIILLIIKWSVFSCYRPEHSIRLERMPDELFEDSTALKHITEFYDRQKPERNEELCKVNIAKESHSNAEQETSPAALEILLNLPKSVQMCFAALIQYLKDFKLEKILRLTRYSCLMHCFIV